MSTIQKAAQTAALEATGLASELYELSQVERVHDVRLDNLADRWETVQAKVEALLNVVKGQAAPVPPPPSPIVYVPVDKFLRASRMGGSHYAIKGFVGGKMDNGGPRPDDARHFPKEAIKDDTKPGFVGVDRAWLLGPHNNDLVVWVQKFPRNITLF